MKQMRRKGNHRLGLLLILALVLSSVVTLLPGFSISVKAAPDGWQQQNPITSETLYSVWGSSSTNVFAVGIGGTIMHFDGSSWSPMNSSITNTLRCIWGASGSDVFAVGYGGKILHYDGSGWSSMTSGITQNLESVWGTSGSDVFAVGTAKILHYDGSNWSEMSHGAGVTLRGVWGNSGSDVFAVGANGNIHHYDGTSWSSMTSGTTNILHSVWGNSGSDVFAVGNSGTILHYDGSSWSSMTSGITNLLHSTWGNSGSDVFAVGDAGNILHYDGSNWSSMTSNSANPFYGVWGDSGIDVFAVGLDGGVFHYDGSTWSPTAGSNTNYLHRVWGTSVSNVFAVGDYGTILKYDGSNWNSMTSGTTSHFRGVWGSSASNIFAVGFGGSIYHSTNGGASWSSMSSGTTTSLYGVWGSSGSDIFVVGSGGTILHYDGSSWSSMTSGYNQPIFAVWGVSGSDVFAVAYGGKILHYDGSSWSSMTSDTTEHLNGVWGESSNDVFAVGKNGTILHYNGSSWSSMTSGTTFHLNGVWGDSGSDVFAVGNVGTIRHYDGTNWSFMSSGTTAPLLSIWGNSNSGFFASGWYGTILNYAVEVDETPPVITISAPTDGAYYQSASVPAASFSATDNLDPSPSVSQSGWSDAEGSHTMTVTATDAAGNSSSASVSYVVDDTPPVIIISAPTDGAYYQSANVPAASFSATDNLDPSPSVSQSGWSDAEGPHTMTVTATDAAGNSSSASVSYIVDDTPPVITVPADITEEATSPSGAVISYVASAVDETDGSVTPTCSPVSGSSFSLGSTTVTCTATDQAGNSASASFDVSVVDTTPPVLVLPPDVTAEANAVLSTVDIGTATATDIFLVTVTNDAPPLFPLGTTVVTWTATDSNGNSTTGTQAVTVVDTTPPELIVPDDITVVAEGVLTQVDVGIATATDIFEPVVITNDAPTDGFPVGNTVVTWTATDANGNVTLAIQVVHVHYQFGGFLPPVVDGGIYKSGRTIPVKIQVFLADGSLVLDLAPTIRLELLLNGMPSGEPLDVDSSSAADTGDTMRLADDHYIYNLSTKALSPGTYRLFVDLHDGSQPKYIDIALK